MVTPTNHAAAQIDNGAAVRQPSRSATNQLYRILLVISNLEYGGAQRQVVEVANNIDPQTFDVQVCSLSDYVPLAEQLHDRHRRLHIIHKHWKFDVTVIARLTRLLRQFRPHVVHGYLFDAEIATRIAGRAAGVPLIVGSERNTDYTLKRRQLVVYRLTRSWVDLVIANSRAGVAFNHRTLGHPQSSYRVIHNGVNVEAFRPQDGSSARAALGIGRTERIVGMFASFKPQKNHALLFAAVTRVFQRVPNSRLLLVGDELYAGMHGSDDYKRQTHDLIDQLGLRERCIFVGNQPDVARLFSVCDITVMPSLFEGTPNAVLESLACGVPVIATDVSDNAYLVPEGRVGFIVPLGDVEALANQICRLLSDDELRDAMSREARRWAVQEFSTPHLAAKTADVYLEGLRQVGRLHSQ
jgi:glycosyltransferase involved in cell wall biosynthesis